MNKSKKPADTSRMAFHTVLQPTLVAGTISYAANPASGISSRLGAEADGWAHFRWVNLKFRLLPPTAAGAVCGGFVGGIQDTLPTTIPQIGELIPSTLLGPLQTVPSEWVRIPQADIAGPLPWYKSLPGTADATEEAPGAFVFAGGATAIIAIEIRGVIEFKTGVNTGNSPEEVLLRSKLREMRLKRELAKEGEQFRRVLSVAATRPGSTALAYP